MGLSVDVVFSFRNEEECLEELIKRLRKVQESSKNINFRFIFVDDSSTDASLTILKNELIHGNITIVVLSRRFGVSPGVFAGLKESQGDVTIYMDADLQDPPELIETMLDEYKKGFDVVHMRRIKRLGESKVKLLFTKFAYFLINRISYIELEPNVGDFKLLSKRARESMLSLDEADPYFRGLSVWIGFRQTTLKYVREARHKGVGHFPIPSGGPILEFIRGITSFSNFLLMISILNGVLGLMIIFIYILVSLMLNFFFSSTINILFFLILLLLLSILFFNLMILGIYISKIFNSSQRRPKYLILEKYQSLD